MRAGGATMRGRDVAALISATTVGRPSSGVRRPKETLCSEKRLGIAVSIACPTRRGLYRVRPTLAPSRGP